MGLDGPAWRRVTEVEGLEVVPSAERIDEHELNNLFEEVGFPRRNPERLRCALDYTFELVGLKEAASGRLLGFARATSDGGNHATIWDVVIHPSRQKRGLGRALVELMIHRVLERDIPVVNLYAEPHIISFYKPLGFEVVPNSKSMSYVKPRKMFTVW